MLTDLHIVMIHLRALWQRLREDEGGYTTETVIVVALLAAAAIAAVAAIAVKIDAKVKSINF